MPMSTAKPPARPYIRARFRAVAKGFFGRANRDSLANSRKIARDLVNRHSQLDQPEARTRLEMGEVLRLLEKGEGCILA